MEERGTRGDKPMKPQIVGWELGKRIPANAIVTSSENQTGQYCPHQLARLGAPIGVISGGPREVCGSAQTTSEDGRVQPELT
jgi:hypothetical protein